MVRVLSLGPQAGTARVMVGYGKSEATEGDIPPDRERNQRAHILTKIYLAMIKTLQLIKIYH